MKPVDDPADQAKIWKVRESGLGATARIPGAPHDLARLGRLRRRRRRSSATTCATCASCFDRYGYTSALLRPLRPGLHPHAGIDFDLVTARGHRATSAPSWTRRPISSSRYGGSLSGEHGDGQARAELLPKMFGPELVRRLRRVQDDLGPRREDESGQGRRPLPHRREPAPRHRLRPAAAAARTSRFAEDDGSFATRRAALRRRRRVPPRATAATMCPSYMVTREEKHSTRGRAHLLFEMLRGDPLARRLAATSACKRRSTSAWPARAARASAPSTWTWRPTRPSSSRTTTPAGSGRAAAYAMGLIHPLGAAGFARAAAGEPHHARARPARAWRRPSRGIAPERDMSPLRRP